MRRRYVVLKARGWFWPFLGLLFFVQTICECIWQQFEDMIKIIIKIKIFTFLKLVLPDLKILILYFIFHYCIR